jgi:cytochrome P450
MLSSFTMNKFPFVKERRRKEVVCAFYQVLPLMKKLSFDVICSLLFGIERGRSRRDKLVTWFQQMIGGIWSVPINLPFTRFNRGLRASVRVRNFLMDLIAEKRMELRKGCWVSPELKHTQIYVVRQLAYSTELLVCINQA